MLQHTRYRAPGLRRAWWAAGHARATVTRSNPDDRVLNRVGNAQRSETLRGTPQPVTNEWSTTTTGNIVLATNGALRASRFVRSAGDWNRRRRSRRLGLGEQEPDRKHNGQEQEHATARCHRPGRLAAVRSGGGLIKEAQATHRMGTTRKGAS